MLFFSSYKSKLGVLLVVGLLATVALPTFLTNNKQIGFETVYNYESSANYFLEKASITGNGLGVYTSAFVVGTLAYYIPNAQLVSMPEPYNGVNKTVLSQQLQDSVALFTAPSGNNQHVLLISEKTIAGYYTALGIPVNDSMWSRFQSQLNSFDRIYDNFYLQEYSP